MTSDAERDPIVQAGALRCGECGCASFPTDAARLDAGLIIADYPAPCSHASGGVQVIDVVDLPAVPPEPSLSLYVRGRRCAGLNRQGQPCGSYARPGSEYCVHHPVVSTARNPA